MNSHSEKEIRKFAIEILRRSLDIANASSDANFVTVPIKPQNQTSQETPEVCSSALEKLEINNANKLYDDTKQNIIAYIMPTESFDKLTKIIPQKHGWFL